MIFFTLDDTLRLCLFKSGKKKLYSLPGQDCYSYLLGQFDGLNLSSLKKSF